MLRLLFSLAVAAWFGTAVCVSFIVTPVVHRNLPTADARRFLRPIFPVYYRMGNVCGLASLAAVLLGRAGLTQEEIFRLAAPVAIALVATLIGGEVLLPQMREIDGEDPRFAQLHRFSAMCNTTTLGALVLAIAGAVLR
jgi:hypothetical protein